MAPKLIVLDKSFLRSVSREKIREMAKEYCFVATTSLLAEFFKHFSSAYDTSTADKHLHIGAMSKFNSETSYLYKFNDIDLLQEELRSHQATPGYIPSPPAICYFSYTEKSSLSTNENDIVVSWCKNIELQVKGLKRKLDKEPILCHWDVELGKLNSLREATEAQKIRLREIIPQYEEIIINNPNFVRQVYSIYMRPSGFPDPELIDEKWLFYRQLQTSLLLYLEKALYVTNDSSYVYDSNLLFNDVVDYEYCCCAGFIGGLATKDKNMKKRFRKLCPNGLLLS